MSRSRVNKIIEGKERGEPKVVRGEYVRIKIWNALTTSPTPLQSVEITKATGCSYEQVKSWLDAWVKFGYVERTALGKSPTGGKRFTHAPIELTTQPPAITLKGEPKAPEHRQYIWESLRHFHSEGSEFYVSDILDFITAKYDEQVNYDYAISYLRDLYNAHYLTSLPTVGRDPLYQVKYNTGLLSPSLCRKKRVFDANLGVMVN